MDEKETCITRIENDDYISVYTSERKFINKIYKLKEQYPDDVTIIHVNPDGSVCVHFPYNWMTFPKPKAKRNYTDEQREAMAERMRRAREGK